ncbi:hypothetical protein [Microlunatus speluncae]|uniref:hypothetical protein n=1 Tax=Microlunatus speluncae TaxID=2594267 RepID=UPI0012665F7F|nr:hypothetical protein [Microlunatus speluncae]
MKTRTILALASLAGVALAGAATTQASADLVTRCIGTGGAVTVPGDLVVPAGKSCVLEGTIVEGKVTVQAGADLVVTDGTFKGAVIVAENGYLDAYNTAVTGKVTSRGGYGATFGGGSSLGAGYAGQAPADASVVPFAYFEDTSVTKNVQSVSGELYLGGSKVAGSVTGDGTVYTDVINSTLTGALTVKGSVDGSVVCASEVDGNAAFDGNGTVQVGGGGLIDDCDDVNYFGGNVLIANNNGGVAVNGNIIRGNLGGEGNDPAPTGADNRVRGTLSGQFVDLQPAAAARRAAPEDRELALKEKVAERKAAAVAEGEAAGSAGL